MLTELRPRSPSKMEHGEAAAIQEISATLPDSLFLNVPVRVYARAPSQAEAFQPSMAQQSSQLSFVREYVNARLRGCYESALRCCSCVQSVQQNTEKCLRQSASYIAPLATFAVGCAVESAIVGTAHMFGAFLILDKNEQDNTDRRVYAGFHYTARESFQDGALGTLPFIALGSTIALGCATAAVINMNYHPKRVIFPAIHVALIIGFATALIGAGSVGHWMTSGDRYVYANTDEIPSDHHGIHFVKKHSLEGLPLLGLLVATLGLVGGVCVVVIGSCFLTTNTRFLND